MYPQTTPQSGTKEGAPIEGALHGADVLIGQQGAQGGTEVRRYLIIEGRAGFGAEDGECSVSPLPIAEDRLSQILLRHVEDERVRIDADRNNAHCLGEIPGEEIALIPDRQTGLSVWIFGCAIDGALDDFDNKSQALESFLRLRAPSPLATFSIGSVQAAPEAVAAFLISIGAHQMSQEEAPTGTHLCDTEVGDRLEGAGRPAGPPFLPRGLAPEVITVGPHRPSIDADALTGRLSKAVEGNPRCVGGLMANCRAFVVESGPSGGPEALALLGADELLGNRFWYAHALLHPARPGRFVALLSLSSRFVNAASVPLLFSRFRYWAMISPSFQPCAVRRDGDAYLETESFEAATSALVGMIARFDPEARGAKEGSIYERDRFDCRILDVYGMGGGGHSSAVEPIPAIRPLRLVEDGD